MANPHKVQRRREEANEGGLHESRETSHADWTELEGDRDEDDQHHHHHHHHHHGGEGSRSDRDYERLAEEAHSRTRGSHDREREQGRQHGRTASQQGRNAGDDERGHTDRYGGRGATDAGSSRSPRTENYRSTGGGTEELSERDRRRSGESQHGQRREQRGRESHEHGRVAEGSQRGSHSQQGVSGRITGQRGEATHHADPSDSTFRERTGGEREHRHGGEAGTSERDRRYGSRRGHGSERDTEHRPSSH